MIKVTIPARIALEISDSLEAWIDLQGDDASKELTDLSNTLFKINSRVAHTKIPETLSLEVVP